MNDISYGISLLFAITGCVFGYLENLSIANFCFIIAYVILLLTTPRKLNKNDKEVI